MKTLSPTGYPYPCALFRVPTLRTGAILRCWILSILLTIGAGALRANVPGAIVSGSSPAVTLTTSGGTATLSNGIISILCTTAGATINQINYTYNNGNGTTTTQLLNGGTDGGMLYWEYGGFGGSSATYSVVVNPATGDANHAAGNYGEIDMLSTSGTNGTVDIHFSMLRGSPGFYVTAIWSHRAVDSAMGMGETRTNIYAGSMFNWMSVDPGRNKLMAVSPSNTSIPVPGAPVECYLWTSGIYQGLYDDKYKYSADFGDEQYTAAPGPHRVWGWSSVGTGGLNVGLWDVNASQEYYNCGPMKRELMCHIGTTILNMFNGDHYAEGTDASFATGEVWNKVYGPYFVYCNNTPTSTTDPYQASQALYNDAVAQGAAEASGTASTTGISVGATAWPYGWFVNSNYAPPSGRGAVTGQIVVSDTGNPNASGSNMMVGLVQQPATSVSMYDFQSWMKPYQFWVHADANGNFSIPNVIAGSNYTLYAFGPGAAGEFMSQNQTGGTPPPLTNVPATPFSVTVTGGAATSLGSVVWTPTRVGATVFEIGYPDRTSRKFRHGDDFWVGDIGPSATSPAPVWTKYLEYPFDFPNGMTYNVGTSRWSTDWDFVEPVITATNGTYLNPTSTINFTLPSAPASGAQGSLYMGLASNMSDASIIGVNGSNLGSTAGVNTTPASDNSNGYYSAYGACDSTIREGNNALFADERLTFPGTLLKAGTNTITITMRQTGGTYFADHIMFDYLRMELTGYVPPAPASVTAYPGNASMLLTWPVTAGATSYNVSRSITSGSNYSSIAAGVLGPVCGSGMQNASWLDTTATNGTTYYYVVQSANTTGTSANSPQSVAAAPSSATATSPPAAPTSVTATPSSGQVAVTWTASPNANFYTVQRSVYALNGGVILGGLANSAEDYNLLGTITLTNTAAGTSYTDTTTTNGSTYTYSVTAANAAGTSGTSTSANAVPLATAPTAVPVVTAIPGNGQVTLNWTAVPGAVGYVIGYATSSGGPYTVVASVTYLTYVISGLNNNTRYYFTVQAVNSGGGASSSQVSATTAPNAPSSLTATAGNTQVTLTWPAVAGATSYSIQRGAVSGGPYTAIGTSVGPSYNDSGLTNGLTYYYVVAASNTAGTGPVSQEATAIPSASLPLAPGSLTASATNSHIALAWNASPGASLYGVLRSTSNGGPYGLIKSVTTTSATDTSVLSGLTYYYVVEAYNGSGFSAYSNQASANLSGTPTLIWTGSSSFAWDYSTANWSTTSGTAAVYTDSINVVFPDTAASGTVTLATAVSPVEVAFTNSTLLYTVNSSGAGISGAAGVMMSGAGEVLVTGPESYLGGTTISSGIYALGADSSTDATTVESPGLTGGTNASLGAATSPVVVTGGGQLRFGGHGSTVETYIIQNPISIDGGSIYAADGVQEFTGGIAINSGGASLLPTWSTKNIEVNSLLSGSGSLVIDDWDATGDSAGGDVIIESASNSYNGVITINPPSSGFLGGVLQVTGSASLVNATIVDNNTSAAGLTFSTSPDFGALSGPGNISISNNRTLSTGFNGTSTTYSGVMSNRGSFNKAGAGTMTLSGSNTYTGTTTVTGGILEITGAIAGSKSLTVASGAVLYLAGGTLSINGAIVNNGTFKLSGSAVLKQTGAFTNNGVLDLINGPQALPTTFTNNGSVLEASSVQVRQVGITGSSLTVTIQGYAQHTYQLQRTLSLASPSWINIGSPQDGAGAPLVFTDPGAGSSAGFYQISVSP